MLPWTFFALIAVGVYCAVQTARDLHRRNYPMPALGAICVGAILLAPIPTHAVKIDLPVTTR